MAPGAEIKHGDSGPPVISVESVIADICHDVEAGLDGVALDTGGGYVAPLDDLKEPLLKAGEAFPAPVTGPRWLPKLWPLWLGIDDSHISKVCTSLAMAIVCSLVACFYYSMLQVLLDFVWVWIPQVVVEPLLGDGATWQPYIYLLLATTFLGLLVGCSLRWGGYPGDLPFMVYCLHTSGQIPFHHFLPMLLCSLASIVGGGSLGPEAAIVLLCGSTAGAIGRALGHRGRRLRTTSLCGMACGFAAFFGVPLGGSLFALEVLHRMGLEFYESASYAVLSGATCSILYHFMMGLELGGIWKFPVDLGRPTVESVVTGAMLGFVGAFGAFIFLEVHRGLGRLINVTGIKKSQLAISALAGLLIGLLGILIPQTLFWGEWEIQSIVDSGQSLLPHIWPKAQLLSYSLTQMWPNFMVAFAKMVAISITLHGGYRGGFIFPYFLTGTAIGAGLQVAMPWMDRTVAMLSVAGALDVAITRTPFGTPLILACLSGQPHVMQPVVMSGIVSLMVTNHHYFQLIRPQRSRGDVKDNEDDLVCHEVYDHAQGE